MISREILKGGGEGIVLRKPASLYLHGRNSSLLKLKASQEDKEGLVVDIRKDSTVSLQMTDGSTFEVPPENVEITEIEVGDVVSFSFDNSVRKEAPSNPRIYRKRTDVSWEQLVRQFIHEELHEHELPMRESKEANNVELREFLERFARNRNMDPLQPNTWYSITLQDIFLDKIGRKMKKEFKSGYYKTLIATFPELSSTIEVNKMLGIHLWGDIENRKKFFENYAKEKGFDPLIAENWYSHPLQIMQSQRARGVMVYYNGSVAQALASLFPNIGIDQSRFSSQNQPVNWINMEKLQNKRDIFREFANEISNDTTQLKNKLFSFKRDDSIVFYKSSSPSKTMADFFPDSKATSKVEMHSKKYWRKVENRKKVFDDYAKQTGFEPLNPEQWYLQSRQNIVQFKNVRSFLGSYQGNVSDALVHLYPTIGLDIGRFPKARNYWSDSDNRKKFFDEFAWSNNFDPLDASKWENVSVRNLLTKKGAMSVLQYYDGSIKQALNVVYGIELK